MVVVSSVSMLERNGNTLNNSRARPRARTVEVRGSAGRCGGGSDGVNGDVDRALVRVGGRGYLCCGTGCWAGKGSGALGALGFGTPALQRIRTPNQRLCLPSPSLVKGGVKLGYAVPKLGFGDLGFEPSGFVCCKVRDKEGVHKWECYGCFSRLSAHWPIRSVDDERSSSSAAELRRLVSQIGGNGSTRLQKDSSPLPRPLSVTDFSVSPNDGTKVRVSYKGLPGSYSEDAALKAYPRCETVPCDEFEDAFKAVELWLAEKAVLPIENSLGGSIHRNYDLLLRHRLHIVGEVQLAANLCLLALPGVRTDHLKRVLSHPQALAQSDIYLSKLGVVRENVDDTAGAAQLVASNGLRDAGVVASARAAEIYGLNILAERIQLLCEVTLDNLGCGSLRVYLLPLPSHAVIALFGWDSLSKIQPENLIFRRAFTSLKAQPLTLVKRDGREEISLFAIKQRQQDKMRSQYQEEPSSVLMQYRPARELFQRLKERLCCASSPRWLDGKNPHPKRKEIQRASTIFC
ncbi:arogenate dehydratase 2 [Actinidia rufa]|uniref:arogenate dehydratase n=1 Tax=Actinidia rufa TaxID=165716 RepID=A0A7J0FFN2_9ERIC|nr:arogenate dehydratase 2 [Actinidia rufa]